MSLASDPGPDGRGRLSVDMRNRVQNMVRPPLPSPPSPSPLPSQSPPLPPELPPLLLGGRLRTLKRQWLRRFADLSFRRSCQAREQGAGPSWMGGAGANADMEGSASFLLAAPGATPEAGQAVSRTVRRVRAQYCPPPPKDGLPAALSSPLPFLLLPPFPCLSSPT